jgi:hypothetical protein
MDAPHFLLRFTLFVGIAGSLFALLFYRPLADALDLSTDCVCYRQRTAVYAFAGCYLAGVLALDLLHPTAWWSLPALLLGGSAIGLQLLWLAGTHVRWLAPALLLLASLGLFVV